MGKAVFAFIVIGLLIGFSWPARHARVPGGAGSLAHEVVLTRGSTGHFFTAARVNGRADIHFVVDTGATIVALTVDDARDLGLDIDPARFDVVGEGAGGAVRGQNVMIDRITVGDLTVEHVPAVVLEGGTMSLLGQSFLSHIDHVDISGDYMSLH